MKRKKLISSSKSTSLPFPHCYTLLNYWEAVLVEINVWIDEVQNGLTEIPKKLKDMKYNWLTH